MLHNVTKCYIVTRGPPDETMRPVSPDCHPTKGTGVRSLPSARRLVFGGESLNPGTPDRPDHLIWSASHRRPLVENKHKTGYYCLKRAIRMPPPRQQVGPVCSAPSLGVIVVRESSGDSNPREPARSIVRRGLMKTDFFGPRNLDRSSEFPQVRSDHGYIAGPPRLPDGRTLR